MALHTSKTDECAHKQIREKLFEVTNFPYMLEIYNWEYLLSGNSFRSKITSKPLILVETLLALYIYIYIYKASCSILMWISILEIVFEPSIFED